MATFEDFFFGSNLALWEEAIADIFQSIEDQRQASLNAIYLSTALLTELADRYGVLVGAKPEPSWQLEVFREHLQEVIQAFLAMSGTRRGIQQVVAATTQIPSTLRPISLLQRWLLGLQYLPNRFFQDLDGFVTAEVDGPYTITDENNLLVLIINGVEQSFTLPMGEAVTAKEVMDAINSTIVGALAFPYGKRFALETIETDVGGSIQVKVESTADTLFGLENTARENAPVPNSGTGVLPFGWRLSASYIPSSSETPPPSGTDSMPISFPGAIFGVSPAKIVGSVESPFIGLLSPAFLTNGGFQSDFDEWDRSEGAEYFISTAKSRTDGRALGVVTKAKRVTAPDGVVTIEPVLNTIKTFPKFIPEGCHVLVSGFVQAKTTGAVYASPSSPPSTYRWTTSNSVYGYVDNQFDRTPVINDPDAPTIVLTDTSVNFITKGIKVGMAVHVAEGNYSFDAVVKGVSTHTLLLDQWRNGPDGGPTTAHISSDAAPESGVTYTSVRLQHPSRNFSTLGVQVGADYRTRDKIRVDETISHFGQVTTKRQVVRDIASLATSTNPNDAVVPDGAWGPSPTPQSATSVLSGSPYSIYIRPHDGTSYTIFYSLNEIPDFVDDFAKISALSLWEVRFLGFDGRVVHSESRFFRPTPGEDYEQITFTVESPKGAEKVQLAVTVGPDEYIEETVVGNFDAPVFLTQRKIVPGSEILTVLASGRKLFRRGDIARYDYEIDYETGAVTFNPEGSAAVENGAETPFQDNSLVRATYDFEAQPGALATIDDIQFRCEEPEFSTELHVAVDGKMQKIVFEDPHGRAFGVISYTGVPDDGDGMVIGNETYEFDSGARDAGTITYTGIPLGGDTITIGNAVYEFDNNGFVQPGRILVSMIDTAGGGLTADQIFTNLTNAINTTNSQVTASINTGTNVITVTATSIGQHDPAIEFKESCTNATISPTSGGLVGGSFPTVTAPRIPVFITTMDDTWARLVEAINVSSTSAFAKYDSAANTVTIFAMEAGMDGNDVVFEKLATPPCTLTPTTGFLSGGSAIRAGGHIHYVDNPFDGDRITIGATTYEFDNDGVVLGSNKAVPILADADATFDAFVNIASADNVVTFTRDDNGLVLHAVQKGTSGNSIAFSAILTTLPVTLDLVPDDGSLGFAVSGEFVDSDAPTCTEVRDYINDRAEGFTASCDSDGHIVLTSDTSGLTSCIVVGHGSANGILGFENDKGKTNSEDAVKPGWRITVGSGSTQLVAVSRAFQPAEKFFGTEWRARFWVKSSDVNNKAHVLVFFEDDEGNVVPATTGSASTGTISSSGTSVTGTGTAFTTELAPGDFIFAAGQVRRVLTNPTNTSLTTDLSFNPALSGEEFEVQHFTLLNPATAPKAVESAVAVDTLVRDMGRFKAITVKLVLNTLSVGDVIDIAYPYLINEVGKSLHLGDNTVPRNKQREYKLHRMAIANPDIFTEVESGLTGSHIRVDNELVATESSDFAPLAHRNLFPYSEIVERMGTKAKGVIQYSTNPSDGDTITIGATVFEFDSNSSFDPGNTDVEIEGTAAETFQNLVDKINLFSPVATATINTDKNTVMVEALLVGEIGNGIVFAQFSPAVKLTPIIGTLDGGMDAESYKRGHDYIMRYAEGEIARTPHGKIKHGPLAADLSVTYSYFPGDIPLNMSYPQTIKPVGAKLEIDPTCLFFFRGRKADFESVDADNVNFDVVERTPSRFSYLKPKVPGRYTQVVNFTAGGTHTAPLDYSAMNNKEAILTKTVDGVTTTIPFNANGWQFVSDLSIELTSGTAHLASGESALFDPEAVYEFVYYVRFSFTSAGISIADASSPYVLNPYSYKASQVDDTKEDVEQVLFLNTSRRASLRLPAVQDQGLAELTRSLAGQKEILSDDQWQFVDVNTVEVFLSAFDTAAIYTLTYKSSKNQWSIAETANEIYEFALSEDDITYGSFETFTPGDVRLLDNFVKFRVTVWGDFQEDEYRLRGFSGIVDDATISSGGFGITPFGRYPFGDGGVCLEAEE